MSSTTFSRFFVPLFGYFSRSLNRNAELFSALSLVCLGKLWLTRVLDELEHTLTESAIELRFAEVKDPVKDKLKRFELFDRFGAADFYPTIGSAVDAYLEEHVVDWKH
jgi:hypothetical protein